MKGGDFTRDTFDKTKHFSRVLMQQGRVQLDADWNEQAAIMLHYLRALAADVIGTHGGTSDSFRIEEKLGGNTLLKDFAIHDGHYYVDGILCELEGKAVPISVQSIDNKKVQVSTWVVDNIEFQEGQYVEVFDAAQPSASPKPFKITKAEREARVLTLNDDVTPTPESALRLRRITTYMTQPGYPVPVDMQLLADQEYLVYLDVWERHITYLEDDGDISIRDAALGGPDTATRAKVVWQVKVWKSASAICDDVKKLERLSLPTLRARVKQTESSNDPCLIQPDARYRGAENQLYRVEIHTGGHVTDNNTMPPTFKWSRENASVIFPILTIASDTTTTTVTLATLGRDDCLGLKTRDWVEIVDDTYTLQNRAAPLLQVSSIDRDTMTVRLTGRTNISINTAPSNHPLLRRWDYKEKKDSDPKLYGKPLALGEDKALKIVEGENEGEDTENWLTLEDDLQIQFPKQLSGQLPNEYCTGDYWLIPARTATGDVEWPTEKGTDGKVISSAMPPHGVEHHYAPLAVISVNADGTVKVEGITCRHTFTPLAS